MYARTGRKSIPPERLLRALLLQMLYSVRSERMLMEQMEYKLLFRWFVGLSMNEAVWHPTVFTKNRDRLLEGEIARGSLRVLRQARGRRLLSDEHFTVDGTLIEAWAGQKSFQLKDDDDILKPPPPPDEPGSNPTIDYRKQKAFQRHAPIQDRSAGASVQEGVGHEAKLAYLGHILTENGNGLVVNTRVTTGHGHGGARCSDRDDEGEPGGRQGQRVTLGADRGYDTGGFRGADERGPGNAACGAEERHQPAQRHRRADPGQPGYAISQRKRKRVEEVFGWMKTVALQRKTRFRGAGQSRMDVHLRGGRLQLGSDAHVGDHRMTRAHRSAPRRSIDDTSRTLNRVRKSS